MTGLMYDVHGNLPALEAVLEDARDVDRWLLGGDYTLFGAWPVETAARLRELDATWIRGNGERWTASPSDAPEPVQGAIAWCAERLGDDFVAVMAALPESWRAEDTLFCHGSPRSDVESFLPEPGDDESELLVGLPASVRSIVFGHTHLAFARESVGGLELANPGSVGMPFDGDHRAAYAVIGEGGEVEHRRVAYDHQASADAIRERIGEAGEQAARRVERAAFDAS
ncbi:MAG TPA: metallophosphoesterase family protein [Thermoleophilaceae bacterium]|nr:metallophosphoesterase family protein [Thermoleophilaceae bacterium]